MRPFQSLRPCLALVALLGGQAALAQVTVTAIVPSTAITGSQPLALTAQVAGSQNRMVTWRVETPNGGACTLDAAGQWQYQPPQQRDELLNVQLRATSVADPDRSTVATLVLMPTNHLWSVINSTLNGQAPRDAKAPDVGAKRKTVLKPEGAEHAAPKRVRREASATPEPEPVPSPALLKWQPATWMQANGNAHSVALPFHCFAPTAPQFRAPAQAKPFARGRAGSLVLPATPAQETIIVGYKTPLELEWIHGQGFQPKGQQLLFGQPGNLLREDVTGRNAILLNPDAPAKCVVSALMPSPTQPGLFLAEDFSVDLTVRGLLPWSGNPAAAPGLDDGTGGEVRFTEPLSLAACRLGKDDKDGHYVAATDAGSHAIRRLVASPVAVTATTPWGKAGEPGHQDGAGQVARFRQPTFLATSPAGGFLVSDTGNQVIRWVEGDQVGTVAGIPGQAGYRDGKADEALFRTPQGLCVDPEDGTVYVADQGNHVIRKITRQGAVSTLAGLAGQAGSTDGVGEQARFTQLKGLARGGRFLFAVDGHAVRYLNLVTGQVGTLCGQVEEPGFAPFGSLAAGQTVLAPRPCLRNPRGLAGAGGFLYVADEGNHCVQQVSICNGTWAALAGDPGRSEVAFGLCRDGLPGPLPPTVGTLAAPKGVAILPGRLLVSSGKCIAKVQAPKALHLALPRVRFGPVAQAKVAVGEPCTVTFTLATAQPMGDNGPQETEPQAILRREALPLLMEYELEFLNGDGTLASRSTGTCTKGQPQFAQGSFTTPGKGRVVFRGRTHQGVGAFAEGGDLEFEVK